MSDADSKAMIDRAAAMIAAAERVVVFTGAGVSTESGIPDFRSPGGLWSRFDPEDFTLERFLSSPETRKKQWTFLFEGGIFAQARPNSAHRAIAWLEEQGKLVCVITQNIDNLHQQAGNSPDRVYELHGNMKWMKCLECFERYPLPEMLTRFRESGDVPECGRCGGLLKPDVVFFGESLPPQTLKEANDAAGNCDLLIVIGSSLVVYPAAYIPMYAKGAGAKLLIVNKTETAYDTSADLVIRGGAGEVMTGIVASLRRMGGLCA
ncbi:MAG: NAD-dependent deacylase [Pseudomonadota bacterium]|nr:NAD-dependent deacylase [Pseudomonadota bacterium]